MTRSEFLESMKAQLEARRDELVAAARSELCELQNVSDDETNSWDDERDDVDTMTDDMNALLLEHAGEELEQINHALERLRDGEYGHCEECGRRIPMERLRAMPFTTHCVHCREELECAEAASCVKVTNREWPGMPWRRNDASAFRSRRVWQVW